MRTAVGPQNHKSFGYDPQAVLSALSPGIQTTMRTMGAHITTVVYLRIVIIQIGSFGLVDGGKEPSIQDVQTTMNIKAMTGVTVSSASA